MKNKLLTLNLIIIAALAVSCDKEPTTSQQLDNAKTETKAAAQDMKDYTFAQKDEFVKYMQGQLAKLDQDLDDLTAKINKSSDAAKSEAQPKLQALRDQEARLKKQLDEVSNASASTWDTVKADTQKAYDSMKDGFNQSRQWVSDKIAP